MPPLTAKQEARLQATRDLLATNPDDYQKNGGLGSVLQAVDIAAFLALAARGRYYRDHLITELHKGIVPVADSATDHEAHFFDRVLDYVEASDQRRQRFAALMSGVIVQLPFARASGRTFDVLNSGAVFDRRLNRFLKAVNQANSGPRSIAGMPSETYWASWIGACGVRIHEHQPAYLCEFAPNFWLGFCKFALARGVTDDMPIDIRQLDPDDHLADGADFITAVRVVVGEREADQFAEAQSRWRANSMSRVISDVVENVMCTLNTNRAVQRPLRAI